MTDIQQSHKCSKICRGIQFFKWLNRLVEGSIPILMAVSTILLAMQQHVIIQENRNQDLSMAVQQREQDLEIERLQREEDLNMSYIQTEEDLDMLQLQREQDLNILQLQRDVDLSIVANQSIHMKSRETLQRKLIEEQRQEDFRIAYANKIEDLVIENNRQKESKLIEYQEELLSILFQHGFEKAFEDAAVIFEIQMKTRTALKQLDPFRRTILMRSLFDAGIFTIKYLKSHHAILANADLSYVDFGESRGVDIEQIDMGNHLYIYSQISMYGANLQNGSFRNALMVDPKPVLVSANLDHFDWRYSAIFGTHFKLFSMNGAIFTHAYLIGVFFEKVHLNQVSFRHIKECSDCQFQSLSMIKADFSQAKFVKASFFRLSMMGSNLSYSSHKKSTFETVDMSYVDLTKTSFSQGHFDNITMIMCQFFDSTFFDLNFVNVNMTGCIQFNESNWIKIKIKSPIFPNGTLISDKCLNC